MELEGTTKTWRGRVVGEWREGCGSGIWRVGSVRWGGCDVGRIGRGD